jgi:asparagine synthase (glutamine-hydrolysing)
MFAFAVWDARERKLHRSRSPCKKPLYYGWQGESFSSVGASRRCSASRLPAAHRPGRARASYLRFSYVPSPRSIYAGIRKLPPAAWLIIRPDRPERWPSRAGTGTRWPSRAGQEDPLRLSDDDAACRLEQPADAVCRAVADVPLGAFLSGGIDSSTVVALLQAQSGLRVSTFTIGYDSSAYDESARTQPPLLATWAPTTSN